MMIEVVAYSQEHTLTLRESTSMAQALDTMTNSLTTRLDAGVHIFTGVWGGPVHLSLEILASAPSAQPTAWWDDISEDSVVLRGDPLVVTVPGTDADTTAELVTLSAGSYRLRVHARGRDLDFDLIAEEPREWYLLQIWPAPPGPPTCLRAGSRVARDLGGRAPGDPVGGAGADGGTFVQSPQGAASDTAHITGGHIVGGVALGGAGDAGGRDGR